MQKSIASLLAILVLLLSCMPCADAFAAAPGEQEVTVSISGLAHDNHSDCPGGCSPFCQCSCCAGFSLPQHAPPLQEIRLFPVSIKAFAFHLLREPAEVYLPIWQPPQVI